MLRILKIATAAVLITAGCATYTSRISKSGEHYYDGRYDRALGELDELVEESSNEDVFLLQLERGKVRLAAGKYDSAIVDLQAAERRFDEIEGTISVTEALSTTLICQGSEEYQPEPHEKILINAYLLIAYWLAGDFEGAAVERNRLVGRLGRYSDGNAAEGSDTLDVPFARYLAAVLYEIEGKGDDARIEYDRVRKINPGAAPERPNTHLTEIIVFAELGRSPVKVSREIRGYFEKSGGRTAGFFTLPGTGEEQAFFLGSSAFLDPSKLGTVFTFAFPENVRQDRLVSYCRPVIDGTEAGTAVMLDDIEETSMIAYKRSLGTILLKSALRTYIQLVAQTKLEGDAGAIAGAVAKFFSVVERADTRSWQTLPSEIAVFRMECPAGDHRVEVQYYDFEGRPSGMSPAQVIRIGDGSKGIAYFPGPD
jgi:tetratricopeptide (TPR) repeat protein